MPTPLRRDLRGVAEEAQAGLVETRFPGKRKGEQAGEGG